MTQLHTIRQTDRSQLFSDSANLEFQRSTPKKPLESKIHSSRTHFVETHSHYRTSIVSTCGLPHCVRFVRWRTPGVTSFWLVSVGRYLGSAFPGVWRRSVIGGPRWGPPEPQWTWEFLVGLTKGRLWLDRFLVALRPSWTMQDQFWEGTDERISGQE